MTQLEALKAIAARNDGLLRPADVIEEARDENSPLHGAFCWDDTEAARLYRLDQAQRLIRKFKVVIEESKGKTIEVPVFIGVSTDRTSTKDENPYRLAEEVAKNKNLLEVAEADALQQLKALKNRYNYLKKFQQLWDLIDSL